MTDRASAYVWDESSIVFGDDMPLDDDELPEDDEITEDDDEPIERAKDYGGTESAFIQGMRKTINDAVSGEGYIGRYSFGIRVRELLRRYGLDAFRDGMAQGGVTVDELDGDDMSEYMNVLMNQSQYIDGLAEDIYVRKAITPDQVPMRASMWAKSLQAFLDSGIGQANANGMFRWEYGPTEHCLDCLRLNGQVHRFKAYKAKGLLPRSSTLRCKGFNCKCRLVKTNEKAKGRF